MSTRRVPLVTGEYYHVFNRSIARQPILITNSNCRRATELVNFYRFPETSVRYSHFVRLAVELKKKYIENLSKQNPQIEIISFTLMPNHYHFLLKQTIDSGITNFISHFQNGYAKYFNLKTQRTGALFQSMFKSVRIETEEQLIHVARYIHLNPLTSFIIDDIEQLKLYPWNSYIDYCQKSTHAFIDPAFLTKFFGSSAKLQEFTENQIDYQRNLSDIMHLALEDANFQSVSTQSTPRVG